MTARAGTCVEDTNVTAFGENPAWVSQCGCGREWPLGQMVDACSLCVQAKCNHPKHGIDIEQGALEL